MKELITILTVTHDTSKCKSNPNPPDLFLINETIASFYNTFPELTGARHIIAYDQKKTSDYLNNLSKFASNKKFDFVRYNNIGSKNIRIETAKLIETEFVINLEHDWTWLTKPNMSDIINVMLDNININYIRFNKRINQIKSIPMVSGRNGGDISLLPIIYSKVNLLATPHFSDNPHIARTKTLQTFWTDIAIRDTIHFMGNGDRIYFENPIQEESFNAYSKHGLEWHSQNWGLFIYGPINNQPVIRHIGE